MGTYLNPGNRQFFRALNSSIYIDKTEMVLYLNSVVNTEQMYVSVSRPRRFGKSMAVNMLCAYYGKGSDSRALFERTKLSSHEGWDINLGKYDVLFLTMTDFIKPNISLDESLLKMQRLLFRDIQKAYPDIDYFEPDNIIQTMSDVYAETNGQFIIIIDEWDSIFREKQEDKNGQRQYLDFLRDWLKNKPYVALAYMTGILPIKKYGKHSALNMFDEYSMVHPMQLASCTGFTTEEVKELCRQYGRDFPKIREWYDGYVVSDIIPPDPDHELKINTGRTPEARKYSLYSPLSVVRAVSTGLIQNYWNKTETYEALAEYIRKDFDGLKETVAVLIDGGRVHVDVSGYQNDMTTFLSRDDVLALLIHLGYLGYDNGTGEVFIPNREILDEFRASTADDAWLPVFESFRASQKLLEATWAKNADAIAEALEKAHDQADNKTYNTEAALSYAIRLAYYAAQKYYTIIPEMDSGKGYADVTFIPSPRNPGIPAMVIELKYEKNTRTGIDQIKEREYPDRLSHYKGNILLISVNYNKETRSDDKKFKHHTCLIEEA